ncbi:hypothetical protein JCM8097_002727 [Rhodosporidiobolus ruineniae]
MAHSRSPAEHSRLARSVVRRVLNETHELVERAGGAAAGGGPAAAAKKADMAAWSDNVSQDLNLAFAGCFLLFLLAVSPLIASWVANGRHARGWFLRSNPVATEMPVHAVDLKKGATEDGGKAEKEKSLARVVSISGCPLPLRTVPSTYLSTHLRTLYNRFLLPSSPLFGLTYGQLLVCLIYEAVVLFCLFYRATDQKADFKRSGAISVAQLPWVFLLASKNSALSVLGKGYEKLNYLHRVGGRLVILCGLLHTLFFLLKSPVNWSSTVRVSGVVLTAASCLILLTSVSYFRRAFYQVFLVSHIVGWVSFIVALFYHVPDFAKPYGAFCLAVYGFDLLLRALKTRPGRASIIALPGGMTMLQSHSLNSGWRAGQHVWVRVWTGARRGWETHPFTVANAASEGSSLGGSHNLTLLAKSCGDWTRTLNGRSSRGNSGWTHGRVVKCSIEGPYGGPMYTDFADAQAVVLFAGGSGMTFAASTLEELVHLAVQGRLRARTVTLVWSVQEFECLEWYTSFLTDLVETAREKTCLNVRLLLHVTKPPPSTSLVSPIPFTSLRAGRPVSSAILSSVVAEVLDSVSRKKLPRGGGVAVGCCGPRMMVEEVRRAVSRVEGEKANGVGGIVLHSETFGW